MQSTSKRKVNKASAGFWEAGSEGGRWTGACERLGPSPPRQGEFSTAGGSAAAFHLSSRHWCSPMTVTVMFKKNYFLFPISKYVPFHLQPQLLAQHTAGKMTSLHRFLLLIISGV